MPLFRPAICVLSALLLFAEGHASDIVILGGVGSIGAGSDAPIFSIADTFSIGEASAKPLPLPVSQGTINHVAIGSHTGTVVYVGADNDNNPLIFQGSVVSQEIKNISIPNGVGTGMLSSAAIDSNGTAIIGGSGDLSNFVFRLPLGANQATQISLPTTDQVEIVAIAITPNNIAILVGQDDITSAPLIYILPTGATEATPISLPDPSIFGCIDAVAVGPDGTAILAGQHAAGNGEALIYRLSPGSLSASAISIPNPDDGGQINSVAIGPDNTAILVGSNGTLTASPLIYQIAPGSASATIIANPNADGGSLEGVAIGSDGTAVMGGTDDTANLPLIYKLSPGASQAASVQLPNSNPGLIASVAIGSENVAVLGGSYSDASQLLIFTLPLADNIASSIAAPNLYDDASIISVAIYSSDGPYDIRRLRPYYYLELPEAINKLNQSGL